MPANNPVQMAEVKLANSPFVLTLLRPKWNWSKEILNFSLTRYEFRDLVSRLRKRRVRITMPLLKMDYLKTLNSSNQPTRFDEMLYGASHRDRGSVLMSMRTELRTKLTPAKGDSSRYSKSLSLAGPFLFVVRDPKTDTILAMGRYISP